KATRLIAFASDVATGLTDADPGFILPPGSVVQIGLRRLLRSTLAFIAFGRANLFRDLNPSMYFVEVFRERGAAELDQQLRLFYAPHIYLRWFFSHLTHYIELRYGVFATVLVAGFLSGPSLENRFAREHLSPRDQMEIGHVQDEL